MRRIRIGTRKSKLASVQTRLVQQLIESRMSGVSLEIVPMSTLGDRLTPERRAEVEGKAVFTEDIESALLDGLIDLAVHSMKDLGIKIPKGLTIAATPIRADPRDVLVSREIGRRFSELRSGATIGTSSSRRKAQLLALRKDVVVVDLHGNVDTRLEKLERLGLDGIVLAAAGLERLGQSSRIAQRFSLDEMVPAPAQGAIAVETRMDDELSSLLTTIEDEKVRAETTCERSFAAALGLDCDIPAGASAVLEGEELSLTASITSPDGSDVARGSMTSSRGDAEALGRRLANRLLEEGGREILRRMS